MSQALDNRAALTPVSSDAPGSEDASLGLRVRRMRRDLGLSLLMLSEMTGLSTGMLSLIERGRATPSIRSLRVLAAALEVPITWFFSPDEPPSAGQSPYIVKAGRRRSLRLTTSKVTKELLMPPGSGIEAYEVSLAFEGSSGPEFLSQKGEKAGIVISGTFRLWLEEYPHLLTAGDSFRFPAQLPHRFDNPGYEAVRVYWIVNAGTVGRPVP